MYDETVDNCRFFVAAAAVSIGDFNGDGYDDIIKAPNNVWINDTTGGFILETLPILQFGDRALSEGLTVPIFERWAGSAAVADLDNDGQDEILSVLRAGPSSELFQVFSRSNDQWVDRTGELGYRAEAKFLANANAIITFDYNNDGWLDVAVGLAGWHVVQHLNRKSGFDSVGMIILRNDEGKGFTDVTAELGIPEAVAAGIGEDLWTGSITKYWRPHTFVHGFIAGDLDNDGFIDLVVAGDYGTGLMLWNEKGKRFTADLENDFTGFANMGPALADVNGDGYQDIFISQINATPSFNNMCPGGRPCHDAKERGNMWHVSNGPRSYTERAAEAGLLDGDWGWGATFVDFDNDGYEELIQAAGFPVALSPTAMGWLSRRDPPHLFQRVDAGSGDRYNDQITSSKNANVGTIDPTGAHHDRWREFRVRAGIELTEPTGGVAVGDFNRDGRIDIVMGSAYSAKPILYLNTSPNVGNWLEITPTTASGKNTIWGANVTVTSSNRNITRISGSQSQSFLSNGTPKLWFGVGDARRVDVTIRYPGGGSHTFRDVETNKSHRLARP
jgi:hypothetical protein